MNRKRLKSITITVVILSSLLAARTMAGTENDIDNYCAMLYSKDDGERETAVAELVRIGRPAVPAVIVALETQEVYLGREGAAKVLGQIRDPRAIRPLVAALRDQYAFVRQQASLALAAIGDPTAVDEILGALDRGGDDFLEAAAATLGLLRDAKALPALEKLSKHPKADVAKTASAAIDQIKSSAPGSHDKR